MTIAINISTEPFRAIICCPPSAEDPMGLYETVRTPDYLIAWLKGSKFYENHQWIKGSGKNVPIS